MARARQAKTLANPNRNLVVRVMPDLDLDSYDWIVVNSSAGKDSQAMLSWLVSRCDAEGVARSKIVVAHADLGRVEWAGTRNLARRQAEALGLRLEVEKRPQGDLLEHVESMRFWPRSVTRYCTSDHKRGQISKILTRLAAEARAISNRPAKILQCMGIRAQESPGRSRRVPLFTERRASGKGVAKHVDMYYPIFDWTVGAVWEEVERSGLPHHHAYDLGMGRLSCVFCVFAPKSMLLIAGKHNRELLDDYVAVEERIGHTFRKDFRIAEVRDALDRGEGAVAGGEDIACWNM